LDNARWDAEAGVDNGVAGFTDGEVALVAVACGGTELGACV